MNDLGVIRNGSQRRKVETTMSSSTIQDWSSLRFYIFRFFLLCCIGYVGKMRLSSLDLYYRWILF